MSSLYNIRHNQEIFNQIISNSPIQVLAIGILFLAWILFRLMLIEVKFLHIISWRLV